MNKYANQYNQAKRGLCHFPEYEIIGRGEGSVDEYSYYTGPYILVQFVDGSQARLRDD